VREELDALMAAQQSEGDEDEDDDELAMTVRANVGAREVTAVMEIEDGARMEVLVRLPAAFPLRPPEVECKQRAG
jgi:E3 ubiquitin-protein ligase listerin